VFLLYGRNGDPFGRGGHAFGQIHVPTALALVHLQNQTGTAWGMVDGRIYKKKIRPHLGNSNRVAVDQQPHFYLGGVAALT